MPGKLPIDRVRARRDAARPYDEYKQTLENERRRLAKAVPGGGDPSPDVEHPGNREEGHA